jgi:CBS domain-containing protein/RNA polymerase-binding transcription factor DksA
MQTSVKEFMSGDPVSIQVDASALEAYETMLRHGIRHLPVLGPDARVVGVITADDLAATLAVPQRPQRPLEPGEARDARGWSVGEIMTHAPEALERDATLAEAAERMAEGRLGCLPIVDEKGRLEGLLSETDLLHALASVAGGGAPRARSRQRDLDELVAHFGQERARIARELDGYHALERELSTDAHDRPMDLPERSAELDVVSLAGSLETLAARRLAGLDRALDHAHQGRLSVCDACGGPISLPRLRALPGTTLCIDCARAAEAR